MEIAMNKKTILKVLGYIWLTLAAIVILAGYVGIYMSRGWDGLWAVLNPFNFVNAIAVVITLFPGIWLLEKAK